MMNLSLSRKWKQVMSFNSFEDETHDGDTDEE